MIAKVAHDANSLSAHGCILECQSSQPRSKPLEPTKSSLEHESVETELLIKNVQSSNDQLSSVPSFCSKEKEAEEVALREIRPL